MNIGKWSIIAPAGRDRLASRPQAIRACNRRRPAPRRRIYVPDRPHGRGPEGVALTGPSPFAYSVSAALRTLAGRWASPCRNARTRLTRASFSAPSGKAAACVSISPRVGNRGRFRIGLASSPGVGRTSNSRRLAKAARRKQRGSMGTHVKVRHWPIGTGPAFRARGCVRSRPREHSHGRLGPDLAKRPAGTHFRDPAGLLTVRTRQVGTSALKIPYMSDPYDRLAVRSVTDRNGCMPFAPSLRRSSAGG